MYIQTKQKPKDVLLYNSKKKPQKYQKIHTVTYITKCFIMCVW